MSGRRNGDPRTRRGLYNPYPSRKTTRTAVLATAAMLAGVALAHGRFEVSGASMLPVLRPGDRLLVRRWLRRPTPGALMVVADPRDAGRLVVKRVTGVGAGGVTLLGDNPAASTDSRSYGPVPASALRGRVVYRYAPRDRAGPVR